VSLEADRKKGMIKKSRLIFKELIDSIDTAVAASALAQSQPLDLTKATLDAAKADAARYRMLWEEAMSREVSLVKQLWKEQKQWIKEKAALTGEKVTPINSKRVRESN
jgi:hypothetical protein